MRGRNRVCPLAFEVPGAVVNMFGLVLKVSPASEVCYQSLYVVCSSFGALEQSHGSTTRDFVVVRTRRTDPQHGRRMLKSGSHEKISSRPSNKN